MFSQQIDDEISLILLDQFMAPRFAELAQENFEYLSQWLDWPYTCKTEYDFRHFIEHSLHGYAGGKSMVCAISYQGQVVGVAGFGDIDHNLSCAKIGYWLDQGMQGKGIVTRICRYLIDYAHAQLMIDKVEISTAKGNKRNRAVCERLGMTLEGVVTNREKVGGLIIDHAIYGIHSKSA